MFWAPFLSGFVACLAIWLSAHFVREWRQRSAFIASLSPADVKNSWDLRQLRATGTRSGNCCASWPAFPRRRCLPTLDSRAQFRDYPYYFKPLRARRPGRSPEYGSLAFAHDRRSRPQR